MTISFFKSAASTILLLTAFVTIATNQGLAHGEDKPGPHWGFIQMPGAFHTEVVPEKSAFRVYLLDIQIENPMIQNSSVVATLNTTGKSLKATCTPKEDYFFCKLPEGASLDSGELKIEAKRDKMTGIPASYKLPLKHTNKKKSGSGGHGHH